MVCLLVVFIAAIIFQGHIITAPITEKFAGFFEDGTGQTSIKKLALIISVAVIGCILIYFILKRFGHIDAVGKFKKILTGILNGLSSIRFVQHKGHVCFSYHSYMGTLPGWYYYWYLCIAGNKFSGIGGGLTTLALGSVGMIVSPGGIGAYAWIVAKLMGWYGLDETTIGNALGWLLWSVQTVVILIGGLVCFALLAYFNKKKVLIVHPEV